MTNEPLYITRPPKPWSEMTDAEKDAYCLQVWLAMERARRK